MRGTKRVTLDNEEIAIVKPAFQVTPEAEPPTLVVTAPNENRVGSVKFDEAEIVQEFEEDTKSEEDKKAGSVSSATIVLPGMNAPTKGGARPSAIKASPFRKQSTEQQDHPIYVDQMQPEDVGISFCIRAAAEFDAQQKIRSASSKDYKHLWGLNDVFPEPTDEQKARAHERKARPSGIVRFKKTLTGVLPAPEPPIGARDSNAELAGLRRMAFAATSEIAVWTQFLLSISAILSCMYVIASCGVEPACTSSTGGSGSIAKFGHLANSILYGLVAIPSRCFFSRVDWRRGEELTLLHEVMMSHLKSPGLYCDLLALCGLAAEFVHLSTNSSSSSSPHRPLPSPAQWVMCLQCLKAWRLLLPEDDGRMVERAFLQGIFNLLLTLFVFAHFVACVFLVIGNFEEFNNSDNWLAHDPYGLDMDNCTVLYIESFYFSVIGLTSVGYGDLLVTPMEHGVNSFFLLISQLFAAKVCADLTWLTSMYNQHEADAHERRRGLVLALHKMGVPNILVKRVLAFQSYENSMHADNMEHPAFKALSTNLREELRLCTYRKLVLQAPFLREQPMEVISYIVNALFDAVYLPSDFIVRAGDPGRELFFIRRGQAKAFLGPHPPIWGQSTEVATIKAGSYFGELAMLTGHQRSSFVMATTYSICSVLPYSAVESLMEQHPEAFTTLVHTMVRMYTLKPSTSWKDLSLRLTKKFGLKDDFEAFEWFKSHDTHESEELHAKAFDKALQKLRTPDLDRRIFWAELDKDASGTIDVEEFSGKLYFASDGELLEISPTPSRGASICEAPKELAGDRTSFTMLMQQFNDNGRWGRQTSHENEKEDGRVGGNSFAMLLQQNRRLLEEIHRLHLTQRDSS